MSLITPTIILDGEFAEPGGRITGRVELPGLEGTDPTVERIREVRIMLRYRTEGRGDTDSWEGPAVSFPVGVDGALTADFTLDVPSDAPVSYDGNLLRLLWEVEARTDLRLRLDKKTSQSIVIVPSGGLGLYRHPHPLS